MDRVDYLFRLFNIDPENRKHKQKYRRCKRKFLMVQLDNGAIRVYGSYNVRCNQPLTSCLNCRRYLNIDILVPKKDIERKGLEVALRELLDMTWGTVNKLVGKYLMPRIEEVVSRLEEEGEVRLI